MTSSVHNSISTRSKLRMAAVLILVFYPLLLFVNIQPRFFFAQIGDRFGNYLIELAVGFVSAYVWIVLAEMVQTRIVKWFGWDSLGYERPMLNSASLIIFLLLGTLFSTTIIEVSNWFTDSLLNLGKPAYAESDASIAHGKRAGIVLFATMALIIYLIILNRNMLVRATRIQYKAERLEKENLETQYQGLKTQVNPHFLFNSLNTLSALIPSMPAKAERFVEELSMVYRYLLRSNEQDLISLKEELGFIRSYDLLLKTRFDEGFLLHINVPGMMLDHRLPPLTLQILVENAVKHNIISSQEPLHVYIEITGARSLSVRNNLQKKQSLMHSHKVGLKNIVSRYALLDQQPEVTISETPSEFIVTVPLISP
jgi:sensor histidine kinase YesM